MGRRGVLGRVRLGVGGHLGAAILGVVGGGSAVSAVLPRAEPRPLEDLLGGGAELLGQRSEPGVAALGAKGTEQLDDGRQALQRRDGRSERRAVRHAERRVLLRRVLLRRVRGGFGGLVGVSGRVGVGGGLLSRVRVVVHRVVPFHDEKAVLVGGAVDEGHLLDHHVDEPVHPFGGPSCVGVSRHAASVVGGDSESGAAAAGATGSGSRRAEPPMEKPVRSPLLTRSQSSSERTRTASSHVPLRTASSPRAKSVGAR